MNLPNITGALTAPKPWQIGAGIGAIVAFVVLGPAVKDMMTVKKKQETANLTQIGRGGEPWHPASFPAEQSRTATTTMPPPPAALVPLLQPAAASAQLAAGTPLRPAGSPAKAPVDPEQEAINSPIMVSTTAAGGGEPPPAPRPAAGRASLDPEGGSATSAMAGLLKPTELPGFRASVMQHPGTTIEQGRIIQCRNVTPMTSGLVGFVQAKIAYDVWSADGTMKLIDRDSTIFGEIGHGLANGQERLFVLWRQVTTPPPNLVRITLNSPAADEMGEAGVPGDINHHYWQKIGGALMLSGIESVFSGISGALSHLGESGSNNSNQSQGLNLNFSQMGSQGSNLASQLLQSTITIPDTLHRDQALPCSIFVSGDLDFGSVYSATRRTSSP